MMPKSGKRFSDDIMLSYEIDHVHDFGWISSKVIVISGMMPKSGKRFSASCSLMGIDPKRIHEAKPSSAKMEPLS